MLSRQTTPADLIGLRVANLSLWLDARGTGIPMALPPCHPKFLAAGPQDGSLVLRVRNGALRRTDGWRSLHHPPEMWELWVDERGRYVFVAPQVCPPRRQVVVDSDFAHGQVTGEFAGGANSGPPVYPLQNVDIRLFANWLAGTGDVILHAAGVAVDGQGYGFAGSSRAGKSTLAASLMSASREAAEAAPTSGETGAVVVLGDDNLVLRYLEGRFWIYGTPWHLDPGVCASGRAPLEKLFFLDRAAPRGVEPLAPLDGVARLLQTAFIPYYRPEAVVRILDRLALLAEEVPFYTLSHELSADVSGLIRDA